MSGQQSPVTPESNGSEVVEESSSEAKPYSREDRERFWKDIQAQTGFNCYLDYVEAYKEVEHRADLELLWHWLRGLPRPGNLSGDPTVNTCTIVDVIAQEDSPPKLSTRLHSTSGCDLAMALSRPPKQACAQVLIWPMTTKWPITTKMSSALYNDLGLSLRIDPQFFLALGEMLNELQGVDDRLYDAVDTRPLSPSHVVIDRSVATLVRHHPFDELTAAPIILIAGMINTAEIVGSKEIWETARVADQSINKPPPFTHPSHANNPVSIPLEGQLDQK